MSKSPGLYGNSEVGTASVRVKGSLECQSNARTRAAEHSAAPLDSRHYLYDALSCARMLDRCLRSGPVAKSYELQLLTAHFTVSRPLCRSRPLPPVPCNAVELIFEGVQVIRTHIPPFQQQPLHRIICELHRQSQTAVRHHERRDFLRTGGQLPLPLPYAWERSPASPVCNYGDRQYENRLQLLLALASTLYCCSLTGSCATGWPAVSLQAELT